MAVENAPDAVEEVLADAIDDMVPTYGYGMIPVVGLGGSAGSIEALQAFFSRMPADSGLAFVVILHLSSEHESTLAELLQRCTQMPVVQVRQSIAIRPNSVYVIPPGKSLRCAAGSLSAVPVERKTAPHVVVDLFFRTLADSHGAHAAAIVLSGMDGDGAIGIKRIKERGGLTVAQDPTEAQHEGMPRSSIGTGMVDWILRVEAMPARLMAYFRLEKRLHLPEEEDKSLDSKVAGQDEKALHEVLAFLHSRTSRDFTMYKRGTIVRRLGRRMQVNGVDNLQSYLVCLGTRPGETAALLQDLLISVTNFFRDASAFEALTTHIPGLFEAKGRNDAVRVWVPGCATGEEAYSVAMLLSEHARSSGAAASLQVFATDIDEEGLRVARQGIYPLTIEADVSEERRDRFFLKEHQGYRVRRELREMVLFATHDMLKDPAFTRLDLVSCRNVLIYLNRGAQQQVLSTFHYALQPGGKLFLGNSDTAEDSRELFLALDKKHRVYVKRPTEGARLARAGSDRPRHSPAVNPGARAAFPHVSGAQFGLGENLENAPKPRKKRWGDLHLEILEQIGPPSLLVDAEHDILHMSPSAGKFMQPAGGEPTRNVFRCIHPELAVGLRAALFQAGHIHEPAVIDPVRLNIDAQELHVSGLVNHTVSDGEHLFLVRFQASPANGQDALPVQEGQNALVARHLDHEIERLKLHLRETVEQYEAAGEEAKASNEELRAVNEELRSATEEMETSREEEQSLIEELTTVNAELQNHIGELSGANSDLHNLMAATEIATIFIDSELRITRYTPAATALFHLIPTDIARPLTDLTSRVHYPELDLDVRRVLETLVPVEREVGQSAGKWYQARLLPYRTLDNRIAGVVLTFTDITDKKRVSEMQAWLSAVVSSTADAIISFDLSQVVLSWNSGAERIFGYTAQEAIGRPLNVLAPVDHPGFEELLRNVSAGAVVENLAMASRRRNGQPVRLALTLSPMRDASGTLIATTVVARDITQAERFAEELRQQDAEYRLIVENAREFAIFATDLSRTVTRWNLAAQGMLGFAEAEIVGHSADVLFTPADRAGSAPEKEAQAALVNGESNDERMFQRKDGSSLWARASLFVLRSKSGEPTGFVKIMRERPQVREKTSVLAKPRDERGAP